MLVLVHSTNSERENLSEFAGNCPLWEKIERNNGPSVFHLNPMALLVMDSGLSKLEISI